MQIKLAKSILLSNFICNNSNVVTLEAILVKVEINLITLN